jgi:ferredoxin
MVVVGADIDLDRCQGHGLCGMECPEVFDVDDGGRAHVLVDPIPPELSGAAVLAQQSCPEQAITLHEAREGEA